MTESTEILKSLGLTSSEKVIGVVIIAHQKGLAGCLLSPLRLGWMWLSGNALEWMLSPFFVN